MITWIVKSFGFQIPLQVFIVLLEQEGSTKISNPGYIINISLKSVHYLYNGNIYIFKLSILWLFLVNYYFQ